MKVYNYSDIDLNSDLDSIHIDVANSSMIDKDICYCIWKEKDLSLEVCFENELNSSDKTILDGIVEGIH